MSGQVPALNQYLVLLKDTTQCRRRNMMYFPKHIDILRMGLPNAYFKGPGVELSKV